MKPIKLVISAFGPYAGLMPEINFEQFDKNGLFLITGETGAGKTMIFDAICYALFGTASGQWRDVKNLRSDHADESTETFVDFYFSHQGREYHVWRRPSYMRKSKRGAGETEQKQNARLYQDGVILEEGITPVNKAIVELLHVTEKQFKQISMIAQGEFREMLNAKTAERTEILRKIFQTDGYKTLTDKLKYRMDTAAADRSSSVHSIAQHFSDVTAQSVSMLEAELQTMQERTKGSPDSWTVDELLALIDRIANEDEELVKVKNEAYIKADSELKQNRDALALGERDNKALEKLDKLKEEKTELEAAAADIEALDALLKRQKAATREVAPADNAWQRKCIELSNAEKAIEKQKQTIDIVTVKVENAEKALTDILPSKVEAEKLQDKVKKLTDEEAEYERRDTLHETLKTVEVRKAELDIEEKKLAEAEEKLKIKISSLKQTAEELKDSHAQLTALEAEKEKIRLLNGKLDGAAVIKLPELKRAEKKLAEKQNQYENSRAEYEAAQKAHTDAERILENCRAGILAAKLQEGQKCPVCGSVHHPEPAKLPPSAVSEEQVSALKSIEEEKNTKKNEAYTAAVSAKTKLDALEKHLIEFLQECYSDTLLKMELSDDIQTLAEQLNPALNRVKKMLYESEQKISAANDDCKKYDFCCEALEKAQGEESEALSGRAKALSDDKAAAEKSRIEIVAALDNLKKLSFESLEEARNEKTRCEHAAKQITDAVENALKAKQSADNELAASKSALETQQENLRLQQQAAAELHTALDNSVRDHGFMSVEEMRTYVVRETEITLEEQRISDYRQKAATNKEMLYAAELETKDMSVIDLEKLRVICAEQQAAVKTLSDEINTISNRIKLNTQKKERIAEQKDTLAAARSEYRLSRRMYELVRGTTGNGKITLEQYVQAAGFDNIIAAANRRLDPMSGGQFQLRRQADNISMQSDTYLDLEVVDSWTGRARPVGNISGGESFKASLSLALGLADTVSSNLGGVQMDALFVDEGFGTLDAKSIDSALDILTSLSQKNRLVGIISHREELKSAIANQIEVSKNRSGSTITINTEE